MSVILDYIQDKRDYDKIIARDHVDEEFEVTSAEISVYKDKNPKKGHTARITFYNDDDEEQLSFFETLFDNYSSNNGGVLTRVRLEAKNPLSTLIRVVEDDDSLKGLAKISIEDLNEELEDLNETIKIVEFKTGNYSNYSFKLITDEDED